MTDLGGISGSREPDPQAVPALSGVDPGREESADELLIRRARETASCADSGGTFGRLMTPYAAIILVAMAGRLEELLANQGANQ